MKPSTRENFKSLAIGLAALAGLILWLKYQPKPPADWSEIGSGAALCPGFDDASLPTSLTIARPVSEGEKTVLAEIRLEKGNGGWIIKTADDAPADSPDRLTMVLAPLMRLTVLSDMREINSHSDETAVREFHRSSKLLDPTGVSGADLADAGIRLTVSGADQEKYADLIIGAVPEGSSEVRDIHYVRVAGEDAVFTADFSGEALSEAGEEKALPYTDRLSADPIDWMNRDLLRISRWNIARMTLYQIAVDEKGTLIPHSVETVTQDPDRSLGRVWERERLVTFDSTGKPAETEITDENRTPDNTPLNERAEQIAHLRFSSLKRLPPALAALAAAGRPAGEWTGFADQLGPLGFRFADHDPADPASVEPVLLGAEGTARLDMKEGISLTVLFGSETADGQAILVIPALDESLFAPPEAPAAPDGISEEEAKRLADEKRLRENELALNRSRAQALLERERNRLSGWVFFLGD